MTDMTLRKPKKSETLEVRLPHETKQAFLSACREDGTTASEVVRVSIDGYLHARERTEPANPARNVIAMIPKPIRNWRYAAGAAGAAALAAVVVLPSAANPDMRANFSRLDKNGDGVLSSDEFFGERDGAKTDKIVIVERHEKKDGGAPVGEPKIEEKAMTFWLGDGAAAGAGADAEEKIVERREVMVFRSEDGGQSVATFDPANLRKREFDRFDADKDGKVSFTEYQTRQREMMTAGFNSLDTDKDGSLNREEYGMLGAPVVIQLTNPDAKDLGTAKVIKEAIQGAPVIKSEVLDERFAKLDKDRNGKLSLSEYLPAQ